MNDTNLRPQEWIVKMVGEHVGVFVCSECGERRDLRKQHSCGGRKDVMEKHDLIDNTFGCPNCHARIACGLLEVHEERCKRVLEGAEPPECEHEWIDEWGGRKIGRLSCRRCGVPRECFESGFGVPRYTKDLDRLLKGTWQCPSCHAQMAWVLTQCPNCSHDRKGDLNQMIDSVESLVEIVDAAMSERDRLHKMIEKVREDNFQIRIEYEELYRSAEEVRKLLDACLASSKKSVE